VSFARIYSFLYISSFCELLIIIYYEKLFGGHMRISICDDKRDLGKLAARAGADKIKSAIETRGEAFIVLESGASQIETLKNLALYDDIQWDKVTVFQFDEFLDIDTESPQSNSYFIQTCFIDLLGEQKLKNFYYLDSSVNTIKYINDIAEKIRFDVAFACIGENGHIGYNDPPANFSIPDPYIDVTLNLRSRKQLVTEGWFKKLDDVPTRAITLSITKLLQSRIILVSCPDQRKARGVAACLFEPYNPQYPCTALRRKKQVSLFLDQTSSMLIMGDRRPSDF
jgi:glucosamine-6-phosphate deaminase